MESLTFEQFVRNNSNEFGVVGSEFRLVISEITEDGSIVFYCHPQGRRGETYDGVLTKFNIYPKTALDNVLKYILRK